MRPRLQSGRCRRHQSASFDLSAGCGISRPLNFTVRRRGYVAVFIPDLSPYRCAFKWSAPLRAVGWLEHPQPYPTGTAPVELVTKLAALVAEPTIISVGFYDCSLCAENGLATTGLMWSRVVYIPGEAEIFVAPGGVIHYVDSHSYLPPARFIEAVLHCPDPDTPAYWMAMAKSNAGVPPPIGPP